MHFAMRSNSALSKTFRGFQKLSEVFRDFQRFSEALRGCQKLSEVFRDFQRLYFLRQNAFGICFQSAFWKNPQKSECSKVCCSGSESCVCPFRTCPACRSRAWIDLGISIECFPRPQEAAILCPWEIKLGSVLDSWFRLHTRQGFVRAFALRMHHTQAWYPHAFRYPVTVTISIHLCTLLLCKNSQQKNIQNFLWNSMRNLTAKFFYLKMSLTIRVPYWWWW